VARGGARVAATRIALSPLARPRTLRAATYVAAIAQRIRLLPRRFSLPPLPLRARPLEATGDDVVLFTGCVMDAWQRDVYADVARVLQAAAVGVTPTGDTAPCCGALELHSGFTEAAQRRANQLIGVLGSDRPILVDAAGCGATMQQYGRLIGTDAAEAFS